REPAGASRHVHRRLPGRLDPEPRNAGPDPRGDRQMSAAGGRDEVPGHAVGPAAPMAPDPGGVVPELRPIDDLSAAERQRLIESMRPEDAEPVPELHEVDIPDELREQIEMAMSKYPEVRSAA